MESGGAVVAAAFADTLGEGTNVGTSVVSSATVGVAGIEYDRSTASGEPGEVSIQVKSGMPFEMTTSVSPSHEALTSGSARSALAEPLVTKSAAISSHDEAVATGSTSVSAVSSSATT